jgi:hypothetical protein
MRSYKAVRKYLDEKFSGSEKLKPEPRLARQITDLILLKAAMKDSGEVNSAIYSAIDTCIEGFIWLYRHGGTHDRIPAIVDTDIAARQYYEHFGMNWDILQNYMRTHASLMDM